MVIDDLVLYRAEHLQTWCWPIFPRLFYMNEFLGDNRQLSLGFDDRLDRQMNKSNIILCYC